MNRSSLLKIICQFLPINYVFLPLCFCLCVLTMVITVAQKSKKVTEFVHQILNKVHEQIYTILVAKKQGETHLSETLLAKHNQRLTSTQHKVKKSLFG